MIRSLVPVLAAALLCQAAPSSAAQPVAPPTAEQAPIALLVDLSSGQTLFSREIDRRFMPASITKAMTALVAFEWIEAGKLFPRQVMTVRPSTFERWRLVGSTMYLPRDARVTVDELLQGVTTVSANDASVVLAEGAAGSVDDWTRAMNAVARRYGMEDSHFNTPNGWMDDGKTFTTARDLATLGRAMVLNHSSKYRRYFGARAMQYNGITQRNHDPITGNVRGADGIKTGFTNQAGYGFLGSAERNGRRLVMVIAASPNGRDRRSAARNLIEWGFENFESVRLFERGEAITRAKVQNGNVREIALVARSPVRLSRPRNSNPEIDLQVQYDGPLRAPFGDEQELGKLVVSIDGKEVQSVPLYAQKRVLEATIFDRVVNGIAGWFG